MNRDRNIGINKTKKAALAPVLCRGLSAFAIAVSFALPVTAYAQSKEGPQARIVAPSEGLSLNMSTTPSLDLDPSSTNLSGNLIDIPLESVGSGLFKLDTSSTSCLTGSESCLTRDNRVNLTGGSSQYLKLNNNGLGIELSPRASLSFDDDSSSALVGALVKIGDDLRESQNFDTNTWYFFAGADAEALTYKPGSRSSLTRGFNLQDRVIVGDAQAGLGYKIGDADLSLAYIRREVSSFSNNDPSDDVSYTEDAAALSFTWRR